MGEPESDESIVARVIDRFGSSHRVEHLEKRFLVTPTVTGIAVLPFENLSHDREDAFFTDGIQDDLLTKLAKIRALKSHQSHQRDAIYPKAAGRNMRQIGKRCESLTSWRVVFARRVPGFTSTPI